MSKNISFNTEFNRFLWSSILIALSACLGNVVDSIIVGNLIGEDGVSAINLSKPITQFMFTISMLLSTGAGMLVGMELCDRLGEVDGTDTVLTNQVSYDDGVNDVTETCREGNQD